MRTTSSLIKTIKKQTSSTTKTKNTKKKNKSKSKSKSRNDNIEDVYIDDADMDIDGDVDIQNIISLEDEVKDTKKVQQYKDYLKKIRDHSANVKYDTAIAYLNQELSKTSDRYLHNEILRISEDLKFQYYKEHPKEQDKLNYPTYYDPNFSQKIFRKAEFYQNKLDKVLPEDVPRIVNERKSGVISLAQHQRFLKNFMSRNTPYNGVLIFHGLGVGKTCASIAIAETLRPTVMANNQKIVIIAKPTFDKGEIFSMDRLKKNQSQCAGDTFVGEIKNPELVKKCQEGHADSCKIVKYKIDKAIKTSYTFYGSLEWAKHVLRELQKAVRGVPEAKHREVEIARIKKMYNNTLLIIDEAHNIKDASENKTRIVPPVLMKVLEHAENLKLVLLSGTPMFNEPADLISILNYLLINDKRPILRESDIFKADGTFTMQGKDILQNYSRGYISFLRSENPVIFPLRFSSSINGDHDIITPVKYPTKDIYGNKLEQGIKNVYNILKNEY